MRQLSVFEQQETDAIPAPPPPPATTAEQTALPPGWSWTTLGDIAELVGGGTPSRQEPTYFGGDIVWLTPTEIPKHYVGTLTDSREHLTAEGLRKSSARIVPVGTVLLTSRASIGYVAIAGIEMCTNQGFASFVPISAVNNRYLAYWLWANAPVFEQAATGTTFKEISKANLRPFRFPLPPLAEQGRIVAAIEAQLSRLDAGVASLRAARTKLKRYRASVLAAACAGRLVPHDPADEPASALLERVREARRAAWEAEQRRRGKDPARARYPEPAAPDTDALPELPEGWAWTTVDQIISALQYGTSVKADSDAENGVPVLRMGNIQDGEIEYENLKYIDPPEGRHTQVSAPRGRRSYQPYE